MLNSPLFPISGGKRKRDAENIGTPLLLGFLIKIASCNFYLACRGGSALPPCRRNASSFGVTSGHALFRFQPETEQGTKKAMPE
jgi:hypothetical protein